MVSNAPTVLDRFKSGEVVPLPSDEEWGEMMARTGKPGRPCEIEEATYLYHRFARLPRWSAPTGEWGFADNGDPLRLFWRSGSKCFCRQLTAEESAELKAPARPTAESPKAEARSRRPRSRKRQR